MKKKITFKSNRHGEGPGKATEELWNSWLDLDGGTLEETNDSYILTNKSGHKFTAPKGEVLAAPLYNRFYSHEKTIFDFSEGSNPTGGVIVICRFKDASRRNEFVIASPFGLAGGSSIAFQVD